MPRAPLFAVLVSSVVIGGCAGSTSAPPVVSDVAIEDPARIEIVPPAQPVPASIVIRKGSFARSRANPNGMVSELKSVLDSARVFAATFDTPPIDPAVTQGAPLWQLLLTAADYGEPNAYTFELQAIVVREREPIANYSTKQSVRQAGRGQLTIGPEQLGQLAERAIRDLVRQLAADADRLGQL